MTSHWRWRLQLGHQVGGVYAAQPKAAVVYIAGSVARGWADRHSDVELDVFWRAAPTDSERIAVLQQSGSRLDVNWADPPSPEIYELLLARHGGQLSQIWPYENEEWSEHFYAEGVNIGVSGFLVETMHRWVADVVESYDTDEDKHMRLAAAQHANPLYGHGQLDAWQTKITYPTALAEAVVREQLAVDESWWQREMLVERDAFVPLTQLLVSAQRRLLRILLALNRIFLPDPRFKWAARLVDQMSLAPVDLLPRLNSVLLAQPGDAIAALEVLFEETLGLVDAHLPAVNTAFAREWLRYRRAIWDEPPVGLAKGSE